MDDLLEYMRRSYEEQFSDLHKWECPQFLDGKICICIHSIAMNYFLYVADLCYQLNMDIKYKAIWDGGYTAYFLKGVCGEQGGVDLLQQQDPDSACYLKNELCRNEKLPFHYVMVRLMEKEDIEKKYLLKKREKGDNTQNRLKLFCKVAKTFRKCTDKEYADLLLRTALFLFPYSTWKLLGKSSPILAERAERIAYVTYNLGLLQAYMDIGQDPLATDRVQIMQTLKEFLGVPIWKIWKDYENEYKVDLLEPMLKDQISQSRKQIRRSSKFIDHLESLLEPREQDEFSKKRIEECRKRVNDLRN